jgi:hypothetical protein
MLVETTGGWRKLPNEELRSLFSLPYSISKNSMRKMRWAMCIACMTDVRSAFRNIGWLMKHFGDFGAEERLTMR